MPKLSETLRYRRDKKNKRSLGSVGLTILLFTIFTGCAASTSQNYDYKGVVIEKTPYDNKYKKVKEYLDKAASFSYEEDRNSDRLLTSSLIKIEMRGSKADYWQLPEETEKKGRGDCEDKAIWLYSKLIREGFEDVRLVIGKYRDSSTSFHAWVVWYSGDKIYILDPTKNKGIWDIKDYPSGYYKPYYSYYRNKKWRHWVVANLEG